MASQRRRSSAATIAVFFFLLSLLAVFFQPAAAYYHPQGKRQTVAVFWGRNKAEGSLRQTCDTGDYNIVIISFLSVFGHGKYWLDLSGPIVNGVNFFIDHGPADHYDDLANRINDYNQNIHDPIGIMLTATVRCSYPDPRMKKALDTKLFTQIHVRFYDDPRCSYNHAGLAGVMAQWNRWSARYPNSRIFLGLAAANVTGKNDMVGVGELRRKLLPAVQKTESYAGVTLWNSYYDSLTHYGRYVKHLA
uniref:GH18 domain-containing protein n=1 Tax=Oryza barthii TaxID=65489 RepID=A0A0D3HQ61_9ORYZ